MRLDYPINYEFPNFGLFGGQVISNGVKKIIFLLFIFYFLVLFQTGFLGFLKTQPNLVLIFLLLILLFEKNNNLKLMSVFWGGFILDIFSNLFLGTSILTLFLIYFLIKIILKNVRVINLPILSGLIVIATLFFELFLPPSSFFFSKIFNFPYYLQFNLGYSILLKIIYNLVLGTIGFILLTKLRKPYENTKNRFRTFACLR